MVGPDAPEIMQGVAIAVKAGAKKHVFDTTVQSPPPSPRAGGGGICRRIPVRPHATLKRMTGVGQGQRVDQAHAQTTVLCRFAGSSLALQ